MTEDSEQRFESDISFECPKCGKHVSTAVEVPEPDWAEVETSSDLVSEGWTLVVCTECTEEFDADVFSSGVHCEVKLRDYPNVIINAEAPFFSPEFEDDDAWLGAPALPEPYKDFLHANLQIAEVLNRHGSEEDGSSLINRMVFSQYLSAFEAYLADTLITNVTYDSISVGKLLESDPHFKEKKFLLKDFLNDPEIVMKEVRFYLRQVVYHRLGQVIGLYKNALKVKLFDSKTTSDAIASAIRHRHDCVHRNGVTVEGEKLQVFTKDYIEKTASYLKLVARNIEDQINPPLELEDDLPF